MDRNTFLQKTGTMLSAVSSMAARLTMQTLVVVPGFHSFFFGAIGGALFGWFGAKHAERKFWDCAYFAFIGVLYSLSAAITGTLFPFKFATSILMGFAWVILELQAKYSQKIVTVTEDSIQFSFSRICYTLVGAIPFAGFAVFDLIVKIQSILPAYKTVEVESANNNQNS
ncbi:MAG: hypothetical protein RLN62_06405 [Rickettsiales bacterium]